MLSIGLSDDCVVFCTRKIKRGYFKEYKYAKIRSMKNYSQDVLIDKLNSVNWLDVELLEDVDDAWVLFKDRFMNVIDDIAPVKHVRLKQHGGDWFNGDILELISKRDKELHKFKKTRKDEHYQEYKRALCLICDLYAYDISLQA